MASFYGQVLMCSFIKANHRHLNMPIMMHQPSAPSADKSSDIDQRNEIMKLKKDSV